MKIKRVILLIADACGVGALPDADQYGDTGAATLPHISMAANGLYMYNLGQFGLGNIVPLNGVPPVENPTACYGKMAEKSPGKDSTTGHWEITGIVLDQPFPVFPNGFPDKLVKRFESRTGLKVIGNKPASGTEIINELGDQHMETGEIILYTSADSVFQLAAHENKIPVEQLYEYCQTARDLCTGEFGVGRVIARPFAGLSGNYKRTANRKDFSIDPPGDTLLDLLAKNDISTIGIGKITDLFNWRGIAEGIKTKRNNEVAGGVLFAVEEKTQHQLIFANFCDFDSLWGHRNNTTSFANGLEDFDAMIEDLMDCLNPDDLLIITADHGCDPTMKNSTDHTREYVPLLVYSESIKSGVNLGTRETFADVAATIAEIFGIDYQLAGTSFLKDIT